MKKITIGLASALGFAIAALLVAPSFIDWTNYRDTFENQLARATGRTVEIEGDVALALLPRPAFQVGAVRIANPPAASNPDFVRAERVAVNLAFGPLLTGRLQFTSIEVIAPVIEAELLEDGSATWQFAPSSVPEGPIRETRNGPADIDFGVDNLSIIDGTVTYRDDAAAAIQSITDINVELTAESASGPFDLRGDVTVAGLRWTVDASLGALRPDRPSALVLNAAGSDISLTLDLAGTVESLPQGSAFSGRFSGSGESLSDVLEAFAVIAPETPIPGELRQSFRFESRIDAIGNAVETDSADLRIGSTTASGGGRYVWGNDPQFSIRLNASRLDLESWQLSSIQGEPRFASLSNFIDISSARAQSTRSNFAFPSGVEGTFEASINLIEWRGQVMRNARVSALLRDSILTIDEAGVDVPGSTTVSFSGTVKANGAPPTLSLRGDAASRDVRTLLEWIDVAPPVGLVPPSRLNSLTIQTQLSGTLDRLVFDPLSVTLDTTELTGSAVIDSRQRTNLSLDLALSNLDIDSYLPMIRNRFEVADSQSQPSAAADQAASSNSPSGAVLNAVDVDMKLTAGSMVAAGYIFRNSVFDMSMSDGVLTLKDSIIEDLAGARFVLNGQIESFMSAPSAQNLSVGLSTQDFSRFSRLLKLDVPFTLAADSPVVIDTTISGTPTDAVIDVSARFGAVNVATKGTVKDGLSSPSFSLSVLMESEDYAALLSSLGMGLATDLDPQGAVAAKSNIELSNQVLQLSDLEVNIGQNAISGSIDYDMSAVRPRMTGSINVTQLDLDGLVPPDPTGQLSRMSRTRGGRAENDVSARWTGDPIDIGLLSDLDAELNVTATELKAKGLDIDQFTAMVALTDGVLTIPVWQGQVYGGPATGSMTVVSGPPIQTQFTLDLKDAALDRIGTSLTGASQASGRVSVQGQFSTQGNSQREMIQSLTGQGMFSASGLDANSNEQGIALLAVIAPVRALSQLGGVFSGGVTEGFASMNAAFDGERGVFTFSDATLQSNVYSGSFSGSVDLPRWWIDAEGRVRLEVNVITQLLGSRLQMPSLIPVTVKGPLDLPDVNMETGTGAAAVQPGTSPEPAQMAPNQTSPPNPVDLFQGILNEVTKPR